MMQIEGKTYFRLNEAAEETGYTEGTIRSYISGGIAEAQKMPDGEWVLTEAGMIALRRRKRELPCQKEKMKHPDPTPAPVQAPPEEKQPDHIVEVNKKAPEVDKTHGSNGQSVHFTTEHHKQILARVRSIADDLGISIKDLTVSLIEKGLESETLKQEMSELAALEQQRIDILKRMRAKI